MLNLKPYLHKSLLALLLSGLTAACVHSASERKPHPPVPTDTVSAVSSLPMAKISETDCERQCSDSDTMAMPPCPKPIDTKHALVVGIGRYKDPAWPEIHGDRDVPMVKTLLNKAGYTHITTLTNSRATKQAIMSEFKRLASSAAQGDTIYIHFSGHGQQITDTNGDEDDGLDEAWIPYDAMREYSDSYHGQTHIIDDEVAIWLTEMRNRVGHTGQILVVVDACHSGDSSRAPAANRSLCARGTSDPFIIPLDSLPHRTPKIPEQWLTITACRDYQVNYEYCTPQGEYYGMLSYAICDKMPDISQLANNQVALILQKFINKHRRSTPQDVTISGATDTHSISQFF